MKFSTAWRVKHRQEFFSPLLPPNALVFDIGANHGEHTAAFLSVGVRQVVAVEPQPDLSRFITKAFPNEIQNGSLITRTQAIGSKNGVGKLFPAEDAGKSMSTLSKQFLEISKENGNRWEEEKAFDVEMITLDSLIDEYGTPDYVKIDVEGFDFEVISGLSRSVALLSFEFNTQPGLIEIAERCIKRVNQLGDYEFNYQAEAPDQTSLQFVRWVNADVMLYALHYDVARQKTYGDIFARLRGRA
jgi:FkbM family methyltransferase